MPKHARSQMTQNDMKPGYCFPGTEDAAAAQAALDLTINAENFGTSMELLQMHGVSDLIFRSLEHLSQYASFNWMSRAVVSQRSCVNPVL